MNALSTWQWAVLAIGGFAFLWPRRAALVEKFQSLTSSLFGGSSSTPATIDANSIAAAYQTIAGSLRAETAAAVRQQLADRLLLPQANVTSSKPTGESIASVNGVKLTGAAPVILDIIQRLSQQNQTAAGGQP